MKLSLYTYLFEKDSLYYLYNSQTGLLSTITPEVYECLYNHDFEGLDQEVSKVLKEKKIIVEDEHLYDYYHLCRQNYLMSIGNNDSLSLVIAPTTGCNFACPYCFEGEKEDKRMSKEVINDLISFIQSSKDIPKIDITWYGGEPLTAFDIMKEIVSRIKIECSQKIISQSIVTNGYLINNKVIEFMKEEKFTSIQITFDGTEEHHNMTRCLKGNGKPTYGRIMANVDKLVSEMPECTTISLRININKDNDEDFAAMFKMINQKYPNHRVHVYPGFIREDNSDNSQMCFKSLSGRSKYNFYRRVADGGLMVDFYPKRQHKGCMICNSNSLIVGPEGELYKCWNDFNHPERIVGYLKDKKMSNTSLIGRYSFESTIYSDPKCKDCKLFPVCDGGCGWFRYHNNLEGKKYDVCTFLSDDHILEECLLMKSVADKKNAIKAV